MHVGNSYNNDRGISPFNCSWIGNVAGCVANGCQFWGPALAIGGGVIALAIKKTCPDESLADGADITLVTGVFLMLIVNPLRSMETHFTASNCQD
ncbi:MAG: hypothetical protein P0S95_08115 [Rhabdochlamydiaceae bacterium]|nr:hypothetical protein [Candidatus Amphrikana amoebophyrae]